MLPRNKRRRACVPIKSLLCQNLPVWSWPSHSRQVYTSQQRTLQSLFPNQECTWHGTALPTRARASTGTFRYHCMEGVLNQSAGSVHCTNCCRSVITQLRCLLIFSKSTCSGSLTLFSICGMWRIALSCFAKMLQVYRQENRWSMETAQYQRGGGGRNATQISEASGALESFFGAITLSTASRNKTSITTESHR